MGSYDFQTWNYLFHRHDPNVTALRLDLLLSVELVDDFYGGLEHRRAVAGEIPEK